MATPKSAREDEVRRRGYGARVQSTHTDFNLARFHQCLGFARDKRKTLRGGYVPALKNNKLTFEIEFTAISWRHGSKTAFDLYLKLFVFFSLLAVLAVKVFPLEVSHRISPD